MGIQCRIIRDNKGKVAYVEAPNGNRSKLYDDAVSRVGEDSALDIVLTAYTPSFTEEVKNPKRDAFRRELIDRINSLPTTASAVTLNLEDIEYSFDLSTLQMTSEDLGNGETLMSFTAEMANAAPQRLAPNGRASKLNPRQYAEVRTPEFMEWSNNWNDVLKDENGEPEVHYHGTVEDRFNEFNSPQGINFFTPFKKIAETYAGFEVTNPDSIYEVYVKSPKTFDPREGINPEVAEFIDKNWKEIKNETSYLVRTKKAEVIEKIYDILQNKEYSWEIIETPTFMNFLKENGYTGIRTAEQGGRNIGIFDNKNVKSAENNVGSFSGETSDIRYSQGENQVAPEEMIQGLVDKLKGTGLAREVLVVSEKEIKEALENTGAQYRQGINGFVLDDVIYINKERAGLDTPIHEFGHLWNSWAKQNVRHIYDRGIDLIAQDGQEYIDFVKKTQPDLTGEEILEEALAQAIGDSGAKLLDNKKRDGFIAWLKSLWKAVALQTGILSYDVAETLGDLSLREFTDAVAIDLFKGNKTYSRPLPVLPVTDISKAPVLKVKKGGHDLSFVTENDLIDIETFLKKASEDGSRVSFWMGDQLGRGMYKDSVTGQEHYLDAGLSYALDPANRSRNVVWASGAAKKTLERLVNESDYVIIMSGSAQSAKLFNKAVFDVFTARVGDFQTFKDATLPVATKPFRQAIEKHDSWESIRNSTDRKKLLTAIIASGQTKASDLKQILESFNAFIDYNTMRDGFLVDNNIDINDMMLVIKPTGVGKKSSHSTYGWEVEGEVIGVPDRKVNAFDVLERKRRAYAGELSDSAQQQVIAPFGIGTGRKIQFSMTDAEAESAANTYLDRINEVIEADPQQYWSVDVPTREQVIDAAKNDRLVDVNGGMGIVTEDGNMIGLFKYDPKAKGTAASVQQARIEKGGIKLDNFDGYLTKLYKKNGFRVVSRLPFNEEFAPELWNKEKHGTPDVVFMVYDPKGDLDIEERTFDKEDYDGALEYRDSFIEDAKLIHPFYTNQSENRTGATQGFFSDVVTGKSDKFKAKKEWTPILNFLPRELRFKQIFDKFKGNFDNHIATSIPTFRETQIKVGSAIRSMLAPAPTSFNEELRSIRDEYVADKNIEKQEPVYTAIDDSLFTQIAEYHAKVKDNRKNPTMVKSYRAFLDETKEQYQYLIDAGYTIEPWMGEGEPYGVDSQAVRDDVINNKHLYYLRSKSATGDNNDADTAENYMPFESSGITINGDDVLMNDLFRAVHDIFGHVSANNSFSPQGELNAYKTHSVMYSDQAQKALFLETVVYNAAYRENQAYAPRKIYNIPDEFIEGINAKPLVYDIGGSEGGFVKAITEESNGAIKSINLDLNSDMRDAHNRVPVEGSEFVLEAFYEGYTDDDGTVYKRHKPKQKADVVHESMVFQFIRPEREGFIKEVKKNYLKEDGIALFEEKLSTYNEDLWVKNEMKKNEYKGMYYSQEELTQKQEEVLVGMKGNQTYREEFLKILKAEFDFVEEYWDAGNFKGYLATNSKAKRDAFLKKIGGKITSEYSENQNKPRFSVGFMQTKQRPEGTQVTLSNVDDQYQGRGIGTEMYKQAASQAVQNGGTLMSDFNSKGAAGIWSKFREEGLTEPVSVDGRVVERIKTTPESFDVNGEPDVSDVITYIQSKNYEGVTLSEAEKTEVANAMIGTDMTSSEELYRAMKRAFTPQGIYNPSEESLVQSGLYSRVEARRLLDNEDLQLAAYEMMHKLKNSDTIENQVDIEGSYITVTSSYNTLGTLKKANPYINKKNAREILGGIKDETLFYNQTEANDLEFANKKFGELSNLTKVRRVKLVNGRLRPETNLDDLRIKMEETLTLPSDNKLRKNLEYLLTVPNDVWNLEFSNVKTILTEIEGNAVDIGLDLSNLNEESYDKTPTEVKTLLNAVRNFVALQNESTFEILLDEYVTFFDLSENQKSATLDLGEDVANKTLVYSETEADSYTLFNEHGLLPLGNNLYQKVNTNKTLEEAQDIVYQTLMSGRPIIPYSAFKAQYDITDPKNAVYVKEDITNFINEELKNIDNSADYDADVLRKMVLFSRYFNTRLNNTETTPSIIEEMDVIVNYPNNAEYLKTEFIADFNKKMLREKVKNSEKWNNFYKHFDISSKGIELVNTDPITMREIQPYLTTDLVNHFRLKKEGVKLDTELVVPIGISESTTLLNYYSNFPKALPLFKEAYQMDNEVLVADVVKDFIRVDEGAFVYVESVGNKALYSRLNTNDTNYKTYSRTLRTPQIGEVSKFNISAGVKADKKVNNLYTKAQDTEITNKIDNC